MAEEAGGRTPAADGLSLYVHVPFCRARCNYCDFYSQVLPDQARARDYLDALALELARHQALAPFVTLYVGGGTPSVLEQPLFGRLLGLLGPLLAPGGEWTMEANPESLTEEKLAAMRAAGVTRLSLGIQSLREDRRSFLGRVHGAQEARAALDRARAAGPAQLSADLLLGLPGQTPGEVDDLLSALEGVDHFSFYILTLEEGTPLARSVAAGQTVLPPPEEQARLLLHCRARLRGLGFPPYEISNAARPGRECRHNLRYWLGGDYLGLGPSAASLLDGVRSRALPDLEGWLDRIGRGEAPIESRERLSPDRAAGERAWLQLRTAAGLDLAEVERLTGCSPAWLERSRTRIAALLEEGLLARQGTRLSLTEQGVLQADGVGAEFLEPPAGESD